VHEKNVRDEIARLTAPNSSRRASLFEDNVDTFDELFSEAAEQVQAGHLLVKILVALGFCLSALALCAAFRSAVPALTLVGYSSPSDECKSISKVAASPCREGVDQSVSARRLTFHSERAQEVARFSRINAQTTRNCFRLLGSCAKTRLNRVFVSYGIAFNKICPKTYLYFNFTYTLKSNSLFHAFAPINSGATISQTYTIPFPIKFLHCSKMLLTSKLNATKTLNALKSIIRLLFLHYPAPKSRTTIQGGAKTASRGFLKLLKEIGGRTASSYTILQLIISRV